MSDDQTKSDEHRGTATIVVLPPLCMRLRVSDKPHPVSLVQELKEGDTVMSVLSRLALRYPELIGTVIDHDGTSILPGVIVATDGLRVSGYRQTHAPLRPEVKLLITSPVVGG